MNDGAKSEELVGVQRMFLARLGKMGMGSDTEVVV